LARVTGVARLVGEIRTPVQKFERRFKNLNAGSKI
jgi:hypothetical protein